jgi:hypothetical protein
MLNIAPVEFLTEFDKVEIVLFKLPFLNRLFLACLVPELSGASDHHLSHYNENAITYSSQEIAKALVYLDMSLP